MKTIPFTKDGLEKIQKEYQSLLKDRPDAVMHLKRARELGDLSENGYYKASEQIYKLIENKFLILHSTYNFLKTKRCNSICSKISDVLQKLTFILREIQIVSSNVNRL